MTKLTPEVVQENRSNLADAYADLLKVANGDKAKLLAGITNLEGISESNRKEFEGLSAEEIVRRIILHIAELRPVQQASPTPEVYSHGQVAQETGQLDSPKYKELLKQAIAVQIEGTAPILAVANTVQAKAAETAKETNEHGVSMKAITKFVSGLELNGVSKEQVLARLKTTLTSEKLQHLRSMQYNGQVLVVTGITESGELVFDTCSIQSLQGIHRYSKIYFPDFKL